MGMRREWKRAAAYNIALVVAAAKGRGITLKVCSSLGRRLWRTSDIACTTW